MQMFKNALLTEIKNEKARSAWDKGVKEYALELAENLFWQSIEDIESASTSEIMKMLLNGANNWFHYSESGCSLCYDSDIAERLCTPSELKRTKHGRLNPNIRESWIMCQGRALIQASVLVRRKINSALNIRNVQKELNELKELMAS